MEGLNTHINPGLAEGFDSFDTFAFVDEDPLDRWPDLRGEKIGVVNTPEQLTIRLWQEVFDYTTAGERAKLAAAIDLTGYVDGFRVRKDGTPTITHPLRDTVRLSSHYGVKDIDMITAMILHDTVEDGSDIITKMAEEYGFLSQDSTDKASAIFDRVHHQSYRDLYRQEQIKATGVILDIWGEEAAYLVAGMTVPDTPPGYDQDKKNQLYRFVITHTTRQDNRLLIMRTSDVTDNGVGLDFIPNVPMDNLRGKIGRAYKYLHVYDQLSNDINREDVDLGVIPKRKITHQLERGVVYAHMLISLDSVIERCVKGEISDSKARETIDNIVLSSDIVDNQTEMRFGAKQLLMNRILNNSVKD